MKLSLAVLTLTLIILGLASAACDGKEPETLGDYLDLLEDYLRDSRGFVDDLDQTYNDSVSQDGDDEQGRLEALKTYFAGFSDHQQDVVAQLEEMNPPDEAKGPHEDLLAARKDGRDIIGEYAQSIQDTTTEAEVGDVAQQFGADLQRVSDAIADACMALQDLADEKDVDVDLGCDGESG